MPKNNKPNEGERKLEFESERETRLNPTQFDLPLSDASVVCFSICVLPSPLSLFWPYSVLHTYVCTYTSV